MFANFFSYGQLMCSKEGSKVGLVGLSIYSYSLYVFSNIDYPVMFCEI